MDNKLTFRRYQDGEHTYERWVDEIFNEDRSYKCPTYVHRTPPCQGSCPSGEDIRGWLQIVRGIEKPPAGGVSWQEYAFRRSTDANPFPAIMGRVCPAPCQEGCNRNEVEDFVGINSVEQFIGDHALAQGFDFDKPERETGKRVAIVGGGVAGLAAAYQLRRLGHGVTIFDERAELGGMSRYGIPGYRMPRDVMDGEIRRILDLGVEVRHSTRVGRDIGFDQLERDYDAILLALGAQRGRTLDIPGGDAPNCVSGVAFLAAFNEGRMQFTAQKVVVIGGGDTAMDVISVARRLGHIRNVHENDRPEAVIRNLTAHDVASAARREGSEVLLIYRRPIANMPASQHEVDTAEKEGVKIRGSLVPVELIIGQDGRARALRVMEVDWNDGKMTPREGSEFDIECDLVVPAVGQSGDLEGLESFDNGRGLIGSDAFYQVPGKPGYFACGDIVRPHLLTTAIGQAAIAADSIDRYLNRKEVDRRPKVDVHHFKLLDKLRETALAPQEYGHGPEWGTDSAGFAVHNYEDRSRQEIISHEMLFLGHFPFSPRHQRMETGVGADEVLGHFEERFAGLPEEEAQAEAGRCMSCGMCFECDNCVIYCPQDAVKRTPKDQATMGRYVYTDYDRCIGCHICAEVCPTGYINMGLGA
jgi:NADPH-dependent glutamate synthase beta subunit-like oxidoreductase/Pyruvate/2-oxoacid:ferredoxin oxidoreductase delta subunit